MPGLLVLMALSQNDEDVNKLKSGNWSSLDIFLFSNGQQYSPPRKYNLRTDDLNWWDTTLNYLARAQYGSKHTSIELYTIEGKRVEGPLELSNGTAYVAVEPPDPFIQSGYHKYLMKASRSWERRQERIISESALNAPVKPNNANNKTIRAEEGNEATNIKIIQDITIVPANAAIKEEQDIAIVTKESVSKDRQSGSKNISVKQLQKQKSCLPQQRPSILRKKYVKPESPLPKKRIPISNVDYTRNKSKSGSSKNLEKVQLDTKSENLVILQIAETKLEGKNKPEPQSISNTVQDHDGKEPDSISLASISEHKISQNVEKEVENMTTEILSVPLNYEEHYQSDYFNPNKIPVIQEKQDLPIELSNTEHKENTNSTTYINACINSNQSSNKVIMPSKDESKTNVLIDKPTKTHEISVVTGSQTAGSFVVIVSQGDTVNFKLNIEVINSSRSINELKRFNQTKSASDTNVQKSEQEEEPHGKVDMFVDNNNSLTGNCREASTLSKSLPSTFTTELQETVSDLKLNQMCGCSCCSNKAANPNKAFPLRAAPVFVDNNNYFILLPSEIGNNNFVSCNCKFKTPTPSKSQIHPIAHENKCLVANNTEDAVELATEKSLTVSISQVELKLFDCKTQCSLSTIPKVPTASLQNNLVTESCACVHSRHKDSYDVLRKQSTTYIDQIVNDVSTQTDWNSLLLEVRREEDGCCSFHIPPLEMLKFYNAL